MEMANVTQVEEFKSSILKNIIEECEEPVNSILLTMLNLSEKNIDLIKDAADLLIIINKHEKDGVRTGTNR
jgi:hypothetical protein